MTTPDPGLQQQRTGLSWTRTSLVVAMNALLVARAGVIDATVALVGAGLVLLLAAVVVMLHGRRRHQRIAVAVAAGRTPVDLAGARGLVVVTALIAAAAVWAVLL